MTDERALEAYELAVDVEKRAKKYGQDVMVDLSQMLMGRLISAGLKDPDKK